MEKGGGGLHILSGCGDLGAVPCFGVTVSIRTLGRDGGGGTTFELRCLPPHDTNVDCSCGHGAGAPLAVAAGAAPDCARVDVQGNFPIKTPHRHRYRGKIGISVGCPGLLRRLPACARVVKVNSLRSGCWK